MTCARLEINSCLSIGRPAPAACHFLQQRHWVEDDAIADHAWQSGTQNSAGNQLQDEFLALMITVWPALCPPAYRATTEKCSDSTSTIFLYLRRPIGRLEPLRFLLA